MSLEEARDRAHALAMGPFSFQAARAARSLGVLARLRRGAATVEEVAATTGLPETSAAVLLEACLAAGLVAEEDDGRWSISRVGRVWLVDEKVQIDAAFTQEVCWAGLADLPDALRDGRPAGLRHLGSWATIYEGLMVLSPEVRAAWFNYDHGHSDSAFPSIVQRLVAHGPARLLDVGANTGRFSRAVLRALPQAEVTLLDHPAQLGEALRLLSEEGTAARATLRPTDLLEHAEPFPAGQSLVWMSQFLDCFGPNDVVALLGRAREALAPDGEVWVLEVCPDRQAYATAARSLRLQSLYFTALANGVSRFYRASEYETFASRAGLSTLAVEDGLGTAHTLIRLGRA